ncbi:hypothetical protein AVEN_105135-1 [Araneus ventricosus]|uniref:DUF5641 domain-containing protein n=1 Tax=Araneus ventricosus TaxID=182803 RepID=A0A4Y2A6T1_ARAVE|nr:hypothetical protein AVEN_1542-1 [Araneus ventricosus]GBL75145.1 hypothetical protein AVEN_226579-1 [Araneus ventricosus]GBL75277.1 hypothetical protein AVEN_105135-1 [Araneus ventricosus]
MLRVDNSKRIRWPLGCITEEILSKDGCVRMVKMRIRLQEFRPIEMILHLELSSTESPKPMKFNELNQSLHYSTENNGSNSGDEQKVC